MKNVKIYCSECGKEIYYDMPENIQKYTTIYEANNSKCCDCILKQIQEDERKETDQ